MHSFESARARSSTPRIDLCAIVPILACAYAGIIGPLLSFGSGPVDIQKVEPGLPQRIFWPAIAAISVVLAARRYSRLGRLTLPPHIICLFAYLAFAGASVLWAFRPEASFVRFLQQMMVLTSIVLPGMLAVRTADLMRGLFLCFAFGAFLNVFFVLENPPSIVAGYGGYPGYFFGKNYLGEFSAVGFLLSLHEILHRGLRRALGIIVLVVAASLLFLADSKTAFALALFVPFVAAFTLIVGKTTRVSPAIILWSIAVCWVVLSNLSGFNIYRLSYILYGDSSLTGRTIIWDFASWEIDRKPLFGWGYQSFWLVGPDAPSIVDAPGWIKTMPNSHNGYYDTMLELGYVGLILLVAFITATLHAMRRLVDIDLRRAWLVLSLALFIIIYNFLESQWMRGFEFLWVVFVIVAADIARYWQAFRPMIAHQHRHRLQLAGG